MDKASNDYLLVRKKALDCPSCLESDVDSFSVFLCGHSICQSCTEVVTRTWAEEKFYECPICLHRVDQKEYESPSRNFVIQNLLNSAIPIAGTELSSQMKEELSNELAMHREKQQLARQTARQQDRVEWLETANCELIKRKRELYRTARFAVAFAVIFLATTINVVWSIQTDVARLPGCPVPLDEDDPVKASVHVVECVFLQSDYETKDEAIEEFARSAIPWCPPSVDSEQKSMWERVWDGILMRNPDHWVVRSVQLLANLIQFCQYVV